MYVPECTANGGVGAEGFRLNALAAECVNCSVKLCLPAVCVLALPLAGAGLDVSTAIEGIENHYNRPRTMQILFEQRYTGMGQRPRTESGVLSLRKPRRMRWEYHVPDGKLFLSDGEDVYFYVPSANRVEKSPLRRSGDLRTPLAFLLGRVDLRQDFKEFRTRPEGENLHITALPRSAKSPYTSVEFLVTPGYQITRLVVHGEDQSVMEFKFSGEMVNPPLDDSEFRFKMPAGAELVELTAADEEEDGG